MPRLLIVCEYPTLLGGERSMLATLNAVAAAGFEIFAAAPPSGPLVDALERQGVTHVAWPTHDGSGVRHPLDRLRSELDQLIRRVRPDLIHANSLSSARIAGPVAAASRVFSFGHFRDIVKLGPQAVADLNDHGRLLAVSAATRDFHVAQGIDPRKCVVLHNGVDLEQFCPRIATGFLHRELNLPASACFVATIGQLGLRKGTDVALEAAELVAADWPDVHWLVVGERTSLKRESQDFEQRLHAIAGRPPLAGRVHFLGTRSDVAEILNECELLVHAARQEPLGRVLLEAAACGLATVATDVGGTREIFPAESDSSLLVPPDNRTALAAAIASLLINPQRRSAVALAARRRAEAAFDIRHAAVCLIEQYHTALAGAL